MKKIKSTSILEVGVIHNLDIKKRMIITAGQFGNIMSFGIAVLLLINLPQHMFIMI